MTEEERKALEEKICFLENQVEELKQGQIIDQKNMFQLEKKLLKIEQALKKIIVHFNNQEHDDTY